MNKNRVLIILSILVLVTLSLIRCGSGLSSGGAVSGTAASSKF